MYITEVSSRMQKTQRKHKREVTDCVLLCQAHAGLLYISGSYCITFDHDDRVIGSLVLSPSFY